MTNYLHLERNPRRRDASRAHGASALSGSDAELRYLYLMVPDGDGFRVLRAPLEEVHEVPARFFSGEADHLPVALNPLDLVVRLGKGRAPGFTGERTEPSIISFGDVEIDLAARAVHRGGEPISLAPLEFDLLVSLARRNGAAVSRSELQQELWEPDEQVAPRTIDTKVALLRRKLEADPSTPRHILTVSKVGYRLRA